MDKNKDRIAEDAAEYLARRASGSKPTSADGMAAWLAADPAHKEAFDEASDLWKELGALQGDQDLIHLKRSDLRAQVGRFEWLRKLRPVAAAAVVVLAAGGAYLYLQQMRPVVGSFASEPGARRELVLDDGTQVMLNIDSEIATSFSKGQRDVVLVRGEADFGVAHDSARPFVVRAGEGSVTALGTQFQVRRDENTTLVTLLQGSVRVQTPRGQQTLLPNEAATLSKSGAITVESIDPAGAEGWKEGRLSFRNTPLAEVVTQANRYSATKLVIADPSLANIRLSGNFKAGDSASIASAAELILPVKVTRDGDALVLVQK
jgi:transmembrane sensor